MLTNFIVSFTTSHAIFMSPHSTFSGA